MFALVLIQVPDEKAEQVRAYAEYMMHEPVKLRSFLDFQLSHLAASLGPATMVEVLSTGQGDYTQGGVTQ